MLSKLNDLKNLEEYPEIITVLKRYQAAEFAEVFD